MPAGGCEQDGQLVHSEAAGVAARAGGPCAGAGQAARLGAFNCRRVRVCPTCASHLGSWLRSGTTHIVWQRATAFPPCFVLVQVAKLLDAREVQRGAKQYGALGDWLLLLLGCIEMLPHARSCAQVDECHSNSTQLFNTPCVQCSPTRWPRRARRSAPCSRAWRWATRGGESEGMLLPFSCLLHALETCLPALGNTGR